MFKWTYSYFINYIWCLCFKLYSFCIRKILPPCEYNAFHTICFDYIIIRVLPQHVPSFSFNHQPHFIPMLTQQCEHSGLQQPITSKWTLLNIWQHFALLYTNTTASPVLQSTKTKHWKKAIHSFWKNSAQSVLKSFMTPSSVLRLTL